MGRQRKSDTHLPPNVYRHGRKFRQAVRIGGKQTWVPLDSAQLAEAFAGEKPTPRQLRDVGFTRGQILFMVRRAKYQAKARGIAFELSDLDLAAMIARSYGACELSGIPFDWKKTAGKRGLLPFSPSIDRIDSSGPYDLKNCRLVCLAVNMALNDWGDSVFKKIAHGVATKDAIDTHIRRLVCPKTREGNMPKPLTASKTSRKTKTSSGNNNMAQETS